MRCAQTILLTSVSILFICACEPTPHIIRNIEFEGRISVECVELSGMVIDLETNRNNSFYDRPLDEYFSVGLRREGAPVVDAIWSESKPQTLTLDYFSVADTSDAEQQAACDLMSDYTESFATQCAGGPGSVSTEDEFYNASCSISD